MKPMTISASRRCCCLTTFTLSPIGLLVGNRFGLRYKSKAELVGGLVLIGIGMKILLEGLGLFG